MEIMAAERNTLNLLDFIVFENDHNEKMSFRYNMLARTVPSYSGLNEDEIPIDFIDEGFNQVFRFKNPNATGECGCGESFSV